MAKYTPPDQPKVMQFIDIIFLVVAVFAALWLPLKAGWAGASKSIDAVADPTWETLGQTAVQAEQWVKLGYADPAAAHDIIRNHFHYDIDWLQLVIMAAVVIGYFVFLFKASDAEYREVIDEKFNGK